MRPVFLFTPEPAREEKEALVRVLAAGSADAEPRPSAYASAWRRAGLLENGSGGATAEELRGDAGVVDP